VFTITQEKIKCPVNNCDKEPTGLHRLITHFRGAHIKGKDEKAIEEALAAIDSIKKDEVKKTLLKEFSEYGPEIDDADEGKVDARKCDGDDEQFIINQYLDSAICREERQYALFLANGLKKCNSLMKDMLELKNCEVLEAFEVLDVFYEATLMRDYWCRNRSKFNEKLRNFAKEKKKWGNQLSEHGREEKNHANYWAKKHPLACWMMNAKPDLAVLYKKNYNESPTLSFIECKYLSRVDNYYYEDDNNRLKCSQVELQELILKFLCNDLELKYSLENGEKHVIVNQGEVLIARFVSGSSEPDEMKVKNCERIIPITRLREIGY